MILASMAATGEDDLICDFAETYGIYDWRKLPVKTAATLAAGLPEYSRRMKRLSGMPCSMDTLLLAAAVDRLSLLVWAKTKNAQKGTKKPHMITDGLLKKTEKKEIEAFADFNAFEAARSKFIKE